MLQSNPPKHAMQLQQTFPSDAQDWYCPECNRRFIMHFREQQEQLDILVLEEGDKFANHTGVGVGELSSIGTIIPTSEDVQLSPELRDALDDIDLDLGSFIPKV